MAQDLHQRFIWTTLPNGGDRDVLRVSLFVGVELEPPEGSTVRLASFPDLLNWPETLGRLRFSIEFQNGPTISERPDGLRRIAARLEPRTTAGSVWADLFGITSGSSPVVVRRRDLAGGRAFAGLGIISYSPRRLKAIVEADPRFGLLTSNAGSVAPAPAISGCVVDGTFRSPELYRVIAARVSENREALGALTDVSLLQQSADSRLFQPAPAVSPSAWHLGLAAFYHDALKNPPANGSRTDELEFHHIVSCVSQYPLLLRQLGLVVDFELPYSALPDNVGRPDDFGPGVPGLARIIVTRAAPATIESDDRSPWTAFERYSHTEVPVPGQPAVRHTHFFARGRDDSEIAKGLLDFAQVDDTGAVSNQLEQVDPLVEALRLITASSSRTDDSGVDANGPGTPHARGIAVVRERAHTEYQQRLAVAAANTAALLAGQAVESPLYANDVARGYRMDIQSDNRWYSLTRRRGRFQFRLRRREAEFGEDEGWTSQTALHVQHPAALEGFTGALAAVDQTLSRWDGWSLAVPRPDEALASSLGEVTTGNVAAAVEVRFEPVPRSLPALRFGKTYRVRMRVVDLAGNSIAVPDLVERLRGVSPPLTFRRFQPLLPPEVIYRYASGRRPQESEYTLVIRSNFDSRCAESAERHLAPPRAAVELVELHGRLDRNGRVDRGVYDMLRERDAANAPSFHDDSRYRAPYLCDPLCVGVIARDVPSPDNSVLKIPFTGRRAEWPEHAPCRIRVLEHPTEQRPASGAVLYHSTEFRNQELTIYLPKGEDRVVQLSSLLREADLELLALWAQIRETLPQSQAVFRERILAGRFPPVTPSRSIRLVHAVRQPLFAPAFVAGSTEPAGSPPAIAVARAPKDSAATIRFTARLPGRTASEYSVTGRWTEFVDERQTSESSHLFQRSLERMDANVEVAGRHEFRDTKHRHVTYTVTANTRFREFFSDQELADRPTTRVSAGLTVHIPNSAVPPAPKTIYVVPTFGWVAQTRTGNTIRRVRRGGGLRVYLERPWFETGEGELLGVVISDASPAASAPANVSVWGRDPIRDGAAPATALVANNQLRGGRVADQQLTLDDGGRVRVVGYPVTFDPDRTLWRCDIVVAPGALYQPFLKLALTRYQPFSLPDHYISSIVVSDFAQLMPDRTASMTIDPLRPGQLSDLRLDTPSIPADSRVEAVVERAEPGVPDEAAWRAISNALALERREESRRVTWTLPSLQVPLGAGRIRVSVREYERFARDTPGTSGETADERLVGVCVLYP